MTFIKRKESVLTKVQRIKGKLDLVLNIRDKKRELNKEAEEFQNMKPLVVFKEGKPPRCMETNRL